MISEDEKIWLEEHFPSLKINEDRTEIQGTLAFTATYDRLSDKFTWLFDPTQQALGEALQCDFKILVKKSTRPDELPTLWLEDEGITKTSNRHFYRSGRACLCGVTEEIDFMSKYSFEEYLGKYVGQFLYGQKYFDKHGKWPWKALAHSTAGIFQSYWSSAKTLAHLQVCLRRLKKCKEDWGQIREILRGSVKVVESRNCFCGRRKNIKACHPDALYGLLKLRSDIKQGSIFLG